MNFGGRKGELICSANFAATSPFGNAMQQNVMNKQTQQLKETIDCHMPEYRLFQDFLVDISWKLPPDEKSAKDWFPPILRWCDIFHPWWQEWMGTGRSLINSSTNKLLLTDQTLPSGHSHPSKWTFSPILYSLIFLTATRS